MTTQISPVIIADNIQYQLKQTVGAIPVYANFNRNWATDGDTGFLTWQLRDVHQPVYTGTTQSNKGIVRPVFQVSVFAKKMQDAFQTSNTILQSLHGYSGNFGNPSTTGFWVSKVDIIWLYNTYDNEIGQHQIILDCTLDVPA